MAAFPSKKYRPASYANTFGARYRAQMARHPFFLFGLPFLIMVVGGSFALTPATAIRYERHDRKVRQLTREEELGLLTETEKGKGNGRRVTDLKEEYYKLAAKDIDNWEQKRVERLPGESDGVLR